MNDLHQTNGIPETEEVYTCLHCGATMRHDMLFCTKCGTPKGEEKTEACAQCGEKLKYGQKYCPKCGEKKNWTMGTKIDYGVRQTKSAWMHGRKWVAVGALVILFIVGTVLFVDKFKLLLTVDELCAEGDYMRAYRRAEDEQKEEIWIENCAAVLYAEIADEFKDSSNLKLENVYYLDSRDAVSGEATKYLLLESNQKRYDYISGEDYIQNQTRVYMWAWDEKEWKILTSYDEFGATMETKENGSTLNAQATARINAFFENDLLGTIEPLPVQ